MFGLGLGEWLIILAAAVLLFGPKYIGRLGRKIISNLHSVGQEFKEGYDQGHSSADLDNSKEK
ncbi:MAG: twin-arginine translocase TatA/TatE family subunit [Candidatus Bruticola sp.]